VGRSGNRPLSFGFGIHHCLGAGLARLEGRLVFGRLLERFRLDLLDADPPRAPGFFGRRLARLPVRFSPLEPS
jgi:cytochrome P450